MGVRLEHDPDAAGPYVPEADKIRELWAGVILCGAPALMFGFRSVRSHIRRANKSGKLGRKEAPRYV